MERSLESLLGQARLWLAKDAAAHDLALRAIGLRETAALEAAKGDPAREAVALAPCLVRRLARGHPKETWLLEQTLLAMLRAGVDLGPVAPGLVELLAPPAAAKPIFYGHGGESAARVLRAWLRRGGRLDAAALETLVDAGGQRPCDVVAAARAQAGPHGEVVRALPADADELLVRAVEAALGSPDPADVAVALRAAEAIRAGAAPRSSNPPLEARAGRTLVELLVVGLRLETHGALYGLRSLVDRGADATAALPPAAALLDDEGELAAEASSLLETAVERGADLAPVRAVVEAALHAPQARALPGASRALSAWLLRTGEEAPLPAGCSHRRVLGVDDLGLGPRSTSGDPPRCLACRSADLVLVGEARWEETRLEVHLEEHRCVTCGKYSQLRHEYDDPYAGMGPGE